MTKFTHAGLRWASDPVIVPQTDPKTGKRLDIWLIYDLAQAFALEDSTAFIDLIGELGSGDRRGVRAIRTLARQWGEQYPNGERDCKTDSDFAAYDDANAAYNKDLSRLRRENATVKRAIYLRVIAATVLSVGGKDVDDPPQPSDLDTWAEWPDDLLEWIANTGLEEARAGLRSKKSSG